MSCHTKKYEQSNYFSGQPLVSQPIKYLDREEITLTAKGEGRWAFSNIASFVRHHALTYINLFKFLDNPNIDWNKLAPPNHEQLNIFQT
ncbi:hypothetical protein RYH73_18450 [Olivibacter sp. CPCC 100613]|uniref:hypothetical protein n=1 Tax=Olivibacter sp. CPCC 100613 TaxID=3079931 RepID=UPI002FF8C211